MKLIKHISIFWLLTFILGDVLAAQENIPNKFNGIITSADSKESIGSPVEHAIVFLVPIDLIDLTPITGINIFDSSSSEFDEPLEDIIRKHGTSLIKSTASTSDGVFSIRGTDVQNKQYFVYVSYESPTDSKFLPGGNKSRKSYSKTELLGSAMTINLTSQPPATADFIGSTRCVGCHNDERHPNWHYDQTGHKLAWSVPGKVAEGQDFSQFPDWFRGLGAWKEIDYKPYDPSYVDLPEGTILELGDPNKLDNPKGSSKFKVRVKGDIRLPIEKVYAELNLWKNSGDDEKYYITIINKLNPNDPNSPLHLPLDLIYGGGVHRQRFIVSVPPELADRQGHYTMLQYNPEGEESRRNRNRRAWRDYKFSHWWGKGSDGQFGTANDIIVPPKINKNTIEMECAGCHVTGAKRWKDPSTQQWLISGVKDIEGAFDLDGDGFLEEVNVGCESCHGPGSKHASILFDGFGGPYYTVNPEHLTAARSDVICGRCHERRVGLGADAKTQAINVNQAFLLPGASRKTLLEEFSHPSSPGPDPKKNLWPDDLHSKSPRQQYSEHIKSKHYVNDRELVSCANCHDAHGASQNSAWLKEEASFPESKLCINCHEMKLNDHLMLVNHPILKSAIINCVDCHMVGTSKPGGDGGLKGLFAKFPPFANEDDEADGLYWQGNLNSHVFDVPKMDNVGFKGVQPNKAMPIPYTNRCGGCHDVTALQNQ